MKLQIRNVILEVGMKFTVERETFTVEILGADTIENEVVVEITQPEGWNWKEIWNLEHVIKGFERGIYNEKIL